MRDTTENLTLPSPAQTLWRKSQQVIHEELQRFGTPRLGGGTVLGARWEHRESSDIDLTVEPRPGEKPVPVAAAILEPSSHLLARLEDLDIGTVKCEVLTEAQFHVSFYNPDDGKVQFGLDIASVNATPRLGERRALVEGSPAVVLSTTQILTGKLQRWGPATLRDAVDFDHAARRDPDSLTFAINTLSTIETNARTKKFRLAATRLATSEDPMVLQMPTEQQPDQATLGQQVADTISGLRYAEVSITVRGGICHFEAKTHNKHSVHVQMSEKRVDSTFASIGINEYLNATLKDPGEIRNKIRHACRRKWRNHPPVLQETHALAAGTNDPNGEDDSPGGRTHRLPSNNPPPPQPGPAPAQGAGAKAQSRSGRRTGE